MCSLVLACATLAALPCGQALAGPVGGLFSKVVALPGNSADTYNFRLIGGVKTTVIVIGNGRTDLDLYVSDQFGNPVASDTDLSDDCAVIFVPPATGNYSIRVVNLGAGGNLYRIVVK